MFVSRTRRHPTARRAIEEADLDQVRLDDFLDTFALLADRCGNRADADRPTVELFDNRRQNLAVNFVQSELVNFHLVERALRQGLRDAPVAQDLRVVAHAPEQTV